MKVYPFKISKTGDQGIVVEEQYDRPFYQRFHQHEEIQVSYIVTGNGTLILSDGMHPFSSGDVFMIGENTPHLFHSKDDGRASHMISIFFNPSSFGPGFFELSELEKIKNLILLSTQGFQFRSELGTIHTLILGLLKARDFGRILLFLETLQKLSLAKKSNLSAFVSTKAVSLSGGKRLQKVFDYVMDHFQEDINLTTMAEMVCMTPPAFCRFFKQHTNKTFLDFLIALRISFACQLLSGPDSLAIAEIAERSGFNTISNFNRMFKKYKEMTPSAYERNAKGHSSP